MNLAARLPAWIFRRLAPNGLTWLLMGSIATISAANLSGAAWVPDSTPLVGAVLGGLLVGIALAKTRFSGWAAAGYHVLLATALLSSWIGKIVPSLAWIASHPAAATLDVLNIRLLTFVDRLAGWAATLAAGQVVQDNGLFLLLIGLIGWGASAWMAWTVLRYHQTFEGLLPAGLLLGINTYLSGQPVEGLWLFLGCAILLAARTTLVGLTHSWQRRQVDYPDELGWSWSGAAVGLVLLILAAARLAPLFGTPEGWQTLADLFKQAEQRLEDTTTRLFGDVAPPRPPDYRGARPAEDSLGTPVRPAPLAQTPEMGQIGAAPSQSTDLVMWVKTSDPPPPMPEPGMPEEAVQSGPIHYWRSGVFGRYTGAGWEDLAGRPPEDRGARPPPPVPEAPPAGRYLLTQEFEIVARHGEELFGANAPVKLTGPEGAGLRYAGPDATPLVSGKTSRYTVHSWVPQVSEIELRAASAAYPPEISETYLALPASLPQRVRDLARRAVGDAATPYDKAVRIQDYLRLSYAYDLRVPPPPAGQDAVDYFLFDAPGGFCSYYASAMAIMLRSQGVAARVASGYAMGYYDPENGAYAVTASQSHAWVEVYFPGYGWIEFEPTAAFGRIGYESSGRISPVSAPSGPAPAVPAWQGLLILAAALLVPAGLFGLLFWRRSRRRAGLAESPALQAERLYLGLRRRLEWAGLPASPGATPAEYLAASRLALAPRGGLADALEQVTALYQQAVYSPRPPTPAQVEQTRRRARQGWGEAARLAAGRLRRRLSRQSG